MGLFGLGKKAAPKKPSVDTKHTDYLANMEVLSRTNLSLLNTMQKMQREYDEMVVYIQQLEAELERVKEIKG